MGDKSPSAKELKQKDAELTEALLEAQFDLRQSRRGPVLVVISGNDFAGKAEAIYAFYERLDNRHLHTRAYALPEGIDRRMPRMWRYWRSLPPAGDVGFYLGSWYHQPLMKLARDQISEAAFRQEMDRINSFERLLASRGTAIVKLWLHLTPEHHKHTQLDLHERETVAMREWGDFSATDYERVRESARLMMECTSNTEAPWVRVESLDPRARDLRIAEILLEHIQRAGTTDEQAEPATTQWTQSQANRSAELDYSLSLDKAEYETLLEQYQNRLRELVRHPRFKRRSLLVVFEGTDAAGKGGAIRRITQCLDPRYLRVHGTSAPTEEERAHPYLWRFWKRIPGPGTVVIFDRSHYGRVLVERVEKLIPDACWQASYAEINDFETQLAESGTLVVKFWLAITEAEQLKRFEARDASPLKRYKLTEEDWRNRKQWDAYQLAMNDMIDHTSTAQAPWHLVPAEDKRYARVETLRILCKMLEEHLE
ncbi:polyphosphate:AMP phosphotransferase [Pseudomonas sp.]|uniref:polyphosphate:AMP phosphotransferase n=1 Tax=Pseudomonas sp. TaxID=306 RepID=UPI00272B3692|nr:polyphosphate:AMP phosphotransferase [Pseudomonas sp.]